MKKISSIYTNRIYKENENEKFNSIGVKKTKVVRSYVFCCFLDLKTSFYKYIEWLDGMNFVEQNYLRKF